MSNTPNKHNDNTSNGTIISTVDTTGSVFLHPSAGVPVTVVKTATGQVANVRGVVSGTTIIFDSTLCK